jgi:hypothetical protein
MSERNSASFFGPPWETVLPKIRYFNSQRFSLIHIPRWLLRGKFVFQKHKCFKLKIFFSWSNVSKICAV